MNCLSKKKKHCHLKSHHISQLSRDSFIDLKCKVFRKDGMVGHASSPVDDGGQDGEENLGKLMFDSINSKDLIDLNA